MGKALKPFVVIVFLLSLVALGLQIFIFREKEVFKGRMVKLEENAVLVARNLEFEAFQKDRLKDFTQMDGALGQLAAAAQTKTQVLHETTATLETTRATLAQRETELSNTRAELAQTQQTLQDTRDSLAQREGELRDERANVARLTGDVQRLTAEVDQKNLEIVGLREADQAQKNQIATLVTQNENHRETIRRLRDGQGRSQVANLTSTGTVLLIDSEWRFVVLSIGSESGLRDGVELLVSRGEEFIGRVVVTAVEKNVAVADVVGNIVLRTGDEVMSPVGPPA